MDKQCKNNGSFQNSLLFAALKGISKEIKSSENTWYAGEHYGNDPRKHPGERTLHYIETGGPKKFIERFRKENPELVFKGGSQKESSDSSHNSSSGSIESSGCLVNAGT